MGRHSRNLSKLLQNVVLATAASIAATQTWAQANQKPREATPHFPRVHQPSLNFYGLPGLIDLPTGEALPDGQFALSYSSFVGGNRTNLTFQATPRITATFRYIGVDNLNLDGFVDYRDRSFDVKYLLFREGKYVPSVAIGLQDFAGTGIYAGEYVAATKTFDTTRLGTIKITGGLGWGRLGSSGSFGSIGGPRPEFDATSTGGSLSVGQWFRGPVAAFGGIEWQVSDRLGLKAELSSDAYEVETRQGLVDFKSQLNFGAEYQFSERLRVGGYYLYGSEFGFNLQLQFNPKRALTPKTIAAPTHIQPRPARHTSPDAWQSEWASVETIPAKLQDIIAPAMRAEGLTLQEFSVSAHVAEVRFTNGRYRNTSLAIGRVARVLARILPASVETFRIVPVNNGLPLSTVVLRRSDLEALEFQPDNADALLAVAGIGDAVPQLDDKVFPPELTQKFSYSVGPYVNPSYFDPDRPVRFDAGVRAEFRYRFSPGWLLAGEVRHSLAGDVEDSARVSNSRLEPVRTNGVLYARATDTSLHQLYLSRQWKPASNIYARTSVGYFEQMFGGVSGEVLWKPSASRLALGVEVNYVGQREFEQRFGFQDYSVATGHMSAYYDFENGFNAQVDVGRYLAGDVGGTFTLTREFKNGWRVGGFFTLTNVSADDFGEGSFDKGIIISAPLDWFLGKPSQRRIGTVVRPIQRDGGARVHVPGRLYEQVRTGHKATLVNEWSRVWE